MINDYKNIDGWFNYEEVLDKSIARLLQRFQRRLTVVEIGAWLGKSSFYLVGNHSDSCNIFIVDTWRGSSDELQSTHKIAQERDIFIDFMKNMKIHHGKFSPIRALSTDASKIFDNNSLDFIFIDGDHSYAGVKSDIEMWLPKLVTNGIIAGHDYSQHFPGVIAAVNEIIGSGNFTVHDNTWVHENISNK